MSRSALSRDSAGSEDRAQFRAFLSDDETRAIVEQVVKDLVIPHASIHKGGIRAGIDFLGEHRSPKLLIVDLSTSNLPLSDINELAEVCEPGITVIAMGDKNDVGLFRELLNHGISDYLVKPVTPALLQKALLASVDSDQRNRQTSKLGRLVTVMGTRGGVGASMLAISLAYHIAEVRRRRVALVDLDLKLGTVALALDLEPSHGFREAMESPARIDSLYLDRTMVKYSDTLHVLSAEENVEDDIFVDTQSVEILMRELRTKFHYVIVDLPRHASAAELSVLDDSSNLMLVTDMSLAGMRDSLRYTQGLPARNAACQVTLVANRVGEHKHGEIPQAEFEKGIGRKIGSVLPFDSRGVANAMNIGQPVAAIKTSLSPGIEALSEILCGGGSSKPARGLLSRFVRAAGD